MKKLLPLLFLFIFVGCGDDNPNEPEPQGSALIVVKSLTDSSNVTSANVILLNANSGESVRRSTTGNDGSALFESLVPGNYFVKISSQGFKESPEGNVTPVPFSVTAGQTSTKVYFLDTVSGSLGMIEGTLNPNLGEVLIVAESQTSSYFPHTYTGPDGYFIIHNVEYGSYKVRALKAGYISSTEPEVILSAQNISASVEVNVLQVTGSSLNGKVTFLAVNNGIVDVSLLDFNSRSVVNGLAAIIDSDRNYSLTKIPTGVYKAWASFKNDGYVMDPDWLFKNPGAIDISFGNDTSKVINFSVTGAIQIISPTNPSNEIVPVPADSIVPLFNWTAYPQAKEYIIEVRDISGKLIWGGFDESGTIRHTQIPKELNSIRFNFDGSASSSLISGDIYQWRIYADDDAAANVQTLLSSSEDLMGLFIAP
jgi:hypothetical protein